MLYGVFVAATTLIVLSTIFLPIIRELSKREPIPSVVEGSNKYLLLVVLSIVAIITSPIAFIIWLVPGLQERFMDTLTESLAQEN